MNNWEAVIMVAVMLAGMGVAQSPVPVRKIPLKLPAGASEVVYRNNFIEYCPKRYTLMASSWYYKQTLEGNSENICVADKPFVPKAKPAVKPKAESEDQSCPLWGIKKNGKCYPDFSYSIPVLTDDECELELSDPNIPLRILLKECPAFPFPAGVENVCDLNTSWVSCADSFDAIESKSGESPYRSTLFCGPNAPQTVLGDDGMCRVTVPFDGIYDSKYKHTNINLLIGPPTSKCDVPNTGKGNIVCSWRADQ